MAANPARVSSCLTINSPSQTKNGGVDNSRAQLLPLQPDETQVLIKSIYYSLHSCRVAKQPSWILRLGLVRSDSLSQKSNFRGGFEVKSADQELKFWLQNTRFFFFFFYLFTLCLPNKNTDIILGILSKTTTSKKQQQQKKQLDFPHRKRRSGKMRTYFQVFALIPLHSPNSSPLSSCHALYINTDRQASSWSCKTLCLAPCYGSVVFLQIVCHFSQEKWQEERRGEERRGEGEAEGGVFSSPGYF